MASSTGSDPIAASVLRSPSTPGVRRAGATAGATAVLLATTEAAGGGPAAMLPWSGGTLVGHLVEQLAVLGVTEVHVVTRPRWHRSLAAALDGSPVRTHVRSSPDIAADLRTIGEVAAAGHGSLIVAHAQIVTHGQALAGLAVDPRIGTGILATTGRAGQPFEFRVRVQRGRIVSAESPYHRVGASTASFLGVLKVAGPDRVVVAAQNARLAAAVAEPSAGFVDELAEKARRWRDATDASDHEDWRRRLAAAPQDAAALTLVGLVRAATPVSASYLRSMVWVRPTSADGVVAAAEEIARVDEDAALLDAAVKATDGFFTTFFVSPYSRYLARWAARLGLTPNQVTTVSLLVGVVAAIAFATGERAGLVTGAVLLQVAFTLDCVDGQLARYTRQFSKLGAWLDSVFDRAKEYAVFAGLAIGAAHAGDPVWTLAGAALALQVVRHTLDFSYAAAQHELMAAIEPLALERVDDGTRVATGGAATAPSPARRAALAGRRVNARGAVTWLKRVIAFPIGERFAAISLVAAIWSAREVFVVLLAWGGLAGIYLLASRLARSVLR